MNIEKWKEWIQGAFILLILVAIVLLGLYKFFGIVVGVGLYTYLFGSLLVEGQYKNAFYLVLFISGFFLFNHLFNKPEKRGKNKNKKRKKTTEVIPVKQK